jgi:putative oxidoreductase
LGLSLAKLKEQAMNSRCNSSAHDFGLLLIRAILGVVLAFHGSQKLFGLFGGPGMEGFTQALEAMEIPMPQVAAYLSAGTEFVGGLLLLVGFATRLVAIPVAFNMFVAAFKAHGGAFSLQADPPGMEYALTLAVVATALIFTGAGQFSVDGCMCRAKSPAPSDG